MRDKINFLYDEVMVEHPNARALFLTLTLPTQPIATASLKPLQDALKRFWAMPEVQQHTLGQVTSIEVKVTGTKDAPTLHVHAHCLVMVPASYFANGVPAVHQTRWAAWFQTAARLDRKPVLDIRAVRGRDGAIDPAAVRSSLREVTKYAISSKGFFVHSDEGISVDPLVTLAVHNVLRNARLVRWNRCFKDAEKRLKRKTRAATLD